MEEALRGVGAVAVVDLGFGDAGKGLLVDALVRRLGARLVVRWHGGAQAGHNVVTEDGRHHTFSQLGAGTFAGADTWLGPDFVFDPAALGVEARRIPGSLGRLTVHGEACVVTPIHVAANRLRERARGAARHGSCGAGVGEVVTGARAGEAVRVRELTRPGPLLDRLRALQARTRDEVPGDGPERAWLEDPGVLTRWLAVATEIVAQVRVGDDERLAEDCGGVVVFEGAQGIGLDETWGLHPYSTWSDCTARGALRWRPDAFVLGVLRSYAHRHGPGPLPTEDAALDLPEPHNPDGPWQGPFRVGWPDPVFARYAVAACAAAGAPVHGLVVTHLDRVRPGWKAAVAYDVALPVAPPDAEGRLAARLATARPVYAPCPRPADALADALSLPLVATAAGPTAARVAFRGSGTTQGGCG